MRSINKKKYFKRFTKKKMIGILKCIKIIQCKIRILCLRKVDTKCNECSKVLKNYNLIKINVCKEIILRYKFVY